MAETLWRILKGKCPRPADYVLTAIALRYKQGTGAVMDELVINFAHMALCNFIFTTYYNNKELQINRL